MLSHLLDPVHGRVRRWVKAYPPATQAGWTDVDPLQTLVKSGLDVDPELIDLVDRYRIHPAGILAVLNQFFRRSNSIANSPCSRTSSHSLSL